MTPADASGPEDHNSNGIQETKRLRVLVADDHPKVRWALRIFMQEEPGFVVVGEASDTKTLMSQARALRPDLVLLQWELAERPISKLLSALRALGPQLQVVVLSSWPESQQAALAAGADDFVSKAGGPEPLLAALRRLTRDRQSIEVTSNRSNANQDLPGG